MLTLVSHSAFGFRIHSLSFSFLIGPRLKNQKKLWETAIKTINAKLQLTTRAISASFNSSFTQRRNNRLSLEYLARGYVTRQDRVSYLNTCSNIQMDTVYDHEGTRNVHSSDRKRSIPRTLHHQERNDQRYIFVERTTLDNKYWINDVKESNKPNAIANTARKFKVHASFVTHRVATVATGKSRVNGNARIVEYPRDIPI